MASSECGCIPWLKYGLGFAFTYSDFTLKDVHQFVLIAVPVIDGRLGPRLQDEDECTELRQEPRLREPALQVGVARVEVVERLDVLIGSANYWHWSLRMGVRVGLRRLTPAPSCGAGGSDS
jgi:hypothetical protein